ncbi:MAG: PASTA domain-containing protein [Chitinophagaceae bacterium]|nr:PASTA domain-containing protein [Chitinophagaceae bacterium]
MFRFITGKPLWINILAGIVLVFILLFVFLLSLDFFTRHGKTLTIPAVTNVSIAEAEKILKAQGFDIEIQDSVFVDTAAPMSVIRQFPEAESVVKQNRTVYLTINRAIAPSIEMPNLEGMSFRTALITLKQYGLKLKDTVFKADFAKNSVLEQQYNDERIKPGAKIAMGSSILLVLGSGLGQDEFNVPDLFSLSFAEAKTLLESEGLSTGAVVPDADVKDTVNAFVYRQSPEKLTYDKRINRIRPGQTIDVWLSVQRPIKQIDSAAVAPTDNTN